MRGAAWAAAIAGWLAGSSTGCSGADDAGTAANTFGDGSGGTVGAVDGTGPDSATSAASVNGNSSGLDSSGGAESTGGAAGVFAPVSVQVDASGNGILEPGESVTLAPRWEENGGAVVNAAGMLSAFGGPGGPSYVLDDDAATYAFGGGPATCDDCYALTVSGARPDTHWDATVTETLDGGAGHQWTLHVGASFSDVPTSSQYYDKIERLVHASITTGCNASQFCPADTTSRQAAASFIARAMAGGVGAVPSSGMVPGLGSYDCAGGISLFSDVSAASPFCGDIHYLAANQITSGCGASPPMFCPADPTLRWHFAVFVAAAMTGGVAAIPTAHADATSGRSYDCPAGDVHFSDVASSAPYCAATHYLWAREVVSGCGATTFCPLDELSREQAASFVANGFDLPLYEP